MSQDRLRSFWERKQEVDEKYIKLLNDLEVEEAAEINHNVSKASNGANASEIIQGIKEYYGNIKTLIQQQRISEQDGLLQEYQQKLEQDCI